MRALADANQGQERRQRYIVDFIAPGILAQSVLFVAIFYGVSVIWERDLGILQKLLTSPAPRSALVLGRALSSGVRALSQAAVVYLVAYLIGVDLRVSLVSIGGVMTAVILGAALFSTFSLIVASDMDLPDHRQLIIRRSP